MPNELFRFTRLINGQKQRTGALGELFQSSAIKNETWLMVSPHDDDLAIGAGLLVQSALAEGVDLQVLVVTDGCQGYCTVEQRDHIVETRRAEMLDSFRILGFSAQKIHTIGYPDANLFSYQGRRNAVGTEMSIAGHTGLQNAFTYHLRHVRPTRVFVPTPTDLHPDHQITHNELMICLFHAGGAIWPELGKPLADVPKVYEMAVYCDFIDKPNIEIHAVNTVLETKLASIAAYKSQLQIAALVENVRQAGAFEYLREVQFKLYSPNNYKSLFA